MCTKRGEQHTFASCVPSREGVITRNTKQVCSYYADETIPFVEFCKRSEPDYILQTTAVT